MINKVTQDIHDIDYEISPPLHVSNTNKLNSVNCYRNIR